MNSGWPMSRQASNIDRLLRYYIRSLVASEFRIEGREGGRGRGLIKKYTGVITRNTGKWCAACIYVYIRTHGSVGALSTGCN